MPSKRRTWDTHTKPGFYLGPSWEHYRCHEVWVEETKAKRVDQSIFFKSKHITQPYLTMSDALILTGEKLCDALSGTAPNIAATKGAIKQLMEIYKGNAEKEQTSEDTQRVKRAVAQSQRVEREAIREANALTRTEEKAKCFLTTLKSDPHMEHCRQTSDQTAGHNGVHRGHQN